MNKEKQNNTPFFSEMKKYIESDPTCFDVPGHKMGNFDNDLEEYAGKTLYKLDVNAPIGLDNLYHPHGVIKEAEDLLADLYNVDEALFSINGTTGGIMTMIIGTIDAKEKIILPRNVHKSIINSLILSGAYPIFVMPDTDPETGIANGVKIDNYIKAMDENPDAKAVFVINPTYFGVTSNIKKLAKEAHERNMIVIADEAHGSHLYFHEDLPLGAMAAGADISSVSLHKTFGSLTQSSAILINKRELMCPELKKSTQCFHQQVQIIFFLQVLM